jgi:3-dehydroquinate dehydratase-2
MKILIINGPNLNLILSRNKEHYGDKDLATIESLIISKFQDVNTSFLTTNDENEIITILQEADRNFDGIIINPGAYTHVSLGI